MKGLILTTVASTTLLCFSLAIAANKYMNKKDPEYPGHVIPYTPYTKSFDATYKFIKDKAPELKPEVIDAAAASLECAKEHDAKHNKILTIIDYSLPSDKKRMWVFDLEKEKLLYNTYVSHAIMSGTKESQFFSNENDSKASSLGVFHTENKYYGRYGAALKLRGLDGKFNDKAYKRFIVLHGSWYTTDDFIKKYGRAGRSWGCPTVPEHMSEEIVDTIKDMSFMFVYYPETNWLTKSKFLNCKILSSLALKNLNKKGIVFKNENEVRGAIIFADTNGNSKHDKFEPIVVIKAADYTKIFKKPAPLTRMLRRQINNNEYIALTQNEFKKLNTEKLADFEFVVPEIIRKPDGRYFETNIVIVEKQPTATLRSTEDFIRWLGL